MPPSREVVPDTEGLIASLSMKAGGELVERNYAEGSPPLVMLTTSDPIMDAIDLSSSEGLTLLQEACTPFGYWPLALVWNEIEGIYSETLKGDAAVAAADSLDAQTVVGRFAAFRQEFELEPDVPSAESMIITALTSLRSSHPPMVEAWKAPPEPINRVALVPASPSDSVAWLGFGGYNECPRPEELAAVLRVWSDDHDAVPIAIASDTVAVHFRALPGKSEHLESLVRQCCAICPDLLMGEDAEPLVRLLAEPAPILSLWWD
jgi:hypothetical protein